MTTKKTMVSSVTVLVLLLLVNLAAVQARQVLLNDNMDGCGGTGGPLLNWESEFIDVDPISANPAHFGQTITGGPSSNPNGCAADWFGFTAPPIVQTLNLNPTTEVPGLYDFQAYFGCVRDGVISGTCTFSLSINGVNIPLTGPFTKTPSSQSGTYSIVTAQDIRIDNPNAVVEIYCPPTADGMDCYVAQATLTFDSVAVDDPHLLGFDGQRFDMIGMPGSSYNLLSDVDIQVNCLLGLQQVNLHSFIPGPVMTIIAILTPNHTILANAGGSSISDTGFVSVDGVKVGEGEKVVTEDGVSVSFEKISSSARDLGLDSDAHIAATSHIEIEGSYRFTVYFVENGRDRHFPDVWTSKFARRYLDLSSALLDDSRAPHGVLGQTHAQGEDKKRSINSWKMEGTEEDYKLSDGVLGSDFAFNKFRV